MGQWHKCYGEKLGRDQGSRERGGRDYCLPHVTLDSNELREVTALAAKISQMQTPKSLKYPSKKSQQAR